MKPEQKNHHMRLERIILGTAATFAGAMVLLVIAQFVK